jgi:hypothetical protein
MIWRLGRRKGRHALGAAVTSIPSVPGVAPAGTPARSWLPEAVVPPVPAYTPVDPDVAPLPQVDLRAVLPVQPEAPREPRAQLTFADGTSASLDPDQARALDEIAQLMTGRDGVKH